MTVAPPAIIFCNNDLTENVKNAIVRQLFIDEAIDGYVFDDRVAADADYPNQIKRSNIRLLVIRSFEEMGNRTLADLVIFVKAGLAAVEENKFGPPGFTLPVVGLSWGALGVFRLPDIPGYYR